MFTATNDTLTSDLYDILVEKNVDTNSLNKYLEFIIGKFSFDCGFIYEADQCNVLNLKEFHVSEIVKCHKNFTMDTISGDLQHFLEKNVLRYIENDTVCTNSELELLHFFSASSLVISSIIDENSHPYGFVIFLNTKTKHNICDGNLKELEILLGILGKCIGMRMYQSKLAFARNSFESILDNTGIDIYVNDFYNHDVLYVNKSMAAPYGGKEEFMKHKCWKTIFPGQHGPCEFCPQHKLIDEHGDPTKVYSWDYQRSFDGSWFRVFSAAFRWVDGRIAHVVSSADITDNKRNEAMIHHLANYDPLTSLPNRRMLVTDCAQFIQAAKGGDRAYLLFFDIDGFKAINDNFGHDAGDEFLIQLGAFFTSMPLLKDCTYRNGGDEFVALISNEMSDGNIKNLANFIHERFKNPWVLKNGSVFCNISIGVACYPEDGVTAEMLVNKADQAMYHIKQSGGAGIGFYREICSEKECSLRMKCE